MANLGSENTPIEGESFGLPSGYSFDEEGGDLVIRDTDGTVAMRRADGTWELESDLALNENDISGVGAFDSESVNTGEVIHEGPSRNRSVVPLDAKVEIIPGNTSEQVNISFDITEEMRDRFFGYEIDYAGRFNETEFKLTFNGDSSDGNGNYDYFDETGVKNEQTDNIPILDASTSAPAYGTITIQNGREYFGRTDEEEFYRIGVSHGFSGGRVRRINGYTDSGGYDPDTIEISSIGFECQSHSLVAELYGVLEN